MDGTNLTLSVLDSTFAICRLDSEARIPAWAMEGRFFSVTRTGDELSIVCESERVPSDSVCERGWRCLRVHGPFAFDLTGILSSLTGPLAAAGVGIFALSTYDTDYLLVKNGNLPRAIDVLRGAGHRVNN